MSRIDEQKSQAEEIGLVQIEDIILEASEALRVRTRISVSECAKQHVHVSQPGRSSGLWDHKITPYIVEPMDCLTSRRHKAVVFVGPAQSGKTQGLVDCWVAHSALFDPSDMLILDSSKEKARQFSKMRIDRLHRNSKTVGAELSKYGGHSDNTFDKIYKSGSMLFIGWPSINQLSGKALKYVALTDYDRMPLDIDGEGDAFLLALKRTQTYLSSGMVLVDTSPGYDVLNPKWTQASPHEAPPTLGGLSLYNTGDRRQFYWKCPECREWFVPGPYLKNVYIPDDGGVAERAKAAKYICSHCGILLDPKLKRELNLKGRWLKEGHRLTKDDEIEGEALISDIASFWLHGTQAGFHPLPQLVQKCLQAEYIYEKTSNEESLKTVTNVDLGAAYFPKQRYQERSPSEFDERLEYWEKRTVPTEVRFLTAGIDIQKDRFVVQVLGWGEGMQQWVVDYVELRYSPRGKEIPIDPAAYLEDWDVLLTEVLEKSYICEGSQDYKMPILCAACDSGGAEGVTDKAYKFHRKIREKRLMDRFILIKGGSSMTAPRIRQSYPDSTSRIDRHASAYGQVPLYVLNTTILKDAVYSDLCRKEKGPGYVHFPDWLGSWYFEGLTQEYRDPKKGWINPNKRGQNEPFDLFGYARVAAIHRGIEQIDWDKPKQPWARPWEENPLLLQNQQNETKVSTNKPKEFTVPAQRNRKNNWLQLDGKWM